LFFHGLVGVGHFERFAGPRQVQDSRHVISPTCLSLRRPQRLR
jgi:hypothetical protein